MKNKIKILLYMFIFIIVYTVTLSSEVYIKGNFGLKEKLPSIDISPNLKLNNSKQHTDNGIRLEYFINNNIGIGVGYSKFTSYKKTKYYNNPISYEYKIPEIEYIPIYIVYKYNICNNFYLKGDLGYSYNKEKGAIKEKIITTPLIKENNYTFKVSNGLFYSFGLGYKYENIVLEISYDVNKLNYKTEYSNYSNFDRKRFTLAIGVKIF